MTRKIIAGVFALAVLNCTLSVGVAAQSGPSCTINFEYTGGYPEKPYYSPWPLPVGYQCGASDGPWTMPCHAPSTGCIPFNAPQETCTACNSGKTPQAAQPIDLATGNTYITQSDISVPGLGGGLRLARTWNSLLPSIQNSYAGMFGLGWRSTYEERLIFNAGDGYLKYAREDGSVWSFGLVSMGPNLYRTVAPGNDTTTITTNTDNTAFTITSWTLVSKSGEKRIFDGTSGALLSIVDRNGNMSQLSYDASSRLITLTDPASRHLNFIYTGSSSNLVSTVTSDVGISLAYSYDAQGRLTQVTKPDNTTITFTYDAQNRITAVKDSDGKILESHAYDALGRGLTSSRANGVDAVTVTYPQ
jgi:YD repeat-containing protein